MKFNRYSTVQKTHEGAIARQEKEIDVLKRLLYTAMLFERTFYLDGESILLLIDKYVSSCSPEEAVKAIVEARKAHGIRHAPLYATICAARKESYKPYIRKLIGQVINRVDELGDFMALWFHENKRKTLPHQVRLGLADAIAKFDEYQLAKYRMSHQPVKLVDVFNLVHPKPTSEEQNALWRRVVTNTLTLPETWETRISSVRKENKDARRKIWEDMLASQALLPLATIRNLRNMLNDEVDLEHLMAHISRMSFRGILPHQVIMAYTQIRASNPLIAEFLLNTAIDYWNRTQQKISGKTAILVDVSGSMTNLMAGYSDTSLLFAASALAIAAEAWFEDYEVFLFSNEVIETKQKRGKLLDDIYDAPHGGTYLGKSIQFVLEKSAPERIVVITDEQSHDCYEDVLKVPTFIMNLAPYQYGVSFKGSVRYISGFSPELYRYILITQEF